MRKLNKLAALLLAMVMVLGITGTAFASESGGYTDVPDWAKDYVDTVTEKGLIDGKTATTFAPNEVMTRADLALALYRLAGSPANAADAVNPYTDVPAGSKYEAAVIWVTDQGIFNGNGDGTFAPDSGSQRQAIAKVLNIFAAKQVKKDTLTSSEDVTSGYPDAGKVAPWAVTHMNWIVASGFIGGTDEGLLDPAGTATRAQVAAILCRYMDDASTGDASKDNSRNGDGIGEKELLVVSFGTSYNDNRVATIKAIEDDMETAFPAYSVRRGFTADIIIEHVLRRDGQKIDSVKEALDRAVKSGVKELVVQPTHLMNGYEYGDLRDLLEKKYADKFDSIKIGAPLLTSDEDFTEVAAAMISAAGSVKDGKTAVCYMGHGTSADSNSVYTRMQEELKAAGYDNYFVGTVESAPTAEDLVKLVKEAGYEKVILRPMMIVAGDHANNDMADPDDPESWYSVFSAAGLEVTCQINGLGEVEAVRQLLVEHAKAAEVLSETKIVSQPNPENAEAEEPAGTTPPAETTEAVKPSLANGVYTIDVTSDSGMFRVTKCVLTVGHGGMTAVLTLSGTGYDQMYAGTKAEAEKATDGVIGYAADAEGAYTFTVPVKALDTELAYAAHAVKSGNWFDRVLTFDSTTTAAVAE